MDLQILAIAVAVIILIVAAISLFLIYGNRERSFEEVYGERRGLNILLDDGVADSSTTKTGKSGASAIIHKDKKKKPTKDAKKEPSPSLKVEETIAENVVVPPVAAAEESTTTAPSRKKRANKKDKNSDMEEKVQNVKQAAEEEIIVNNVETAPEATVVEEKEEIVVVQEVVQSQQPAEKTVLPKKKKQKVVNVEKSNESQPKQSSIDATDSDNTPINVAMKRLNVNPLTPDQLEIVANFYMERSVVPQMDGPTEQSFLKKIDEKERALTQEKQRVVTTLQTISNLNQELIAERQRNSGLERSFKEQLNLIQTENQQLNQQLRDCQAQMATKMQRYHQMETDIRKIDTHHAQEIQALREDAQRKIHTLQQECLHHNLLVQKQEGELKQLRDLQEATVSQQVLESKNALMLKEQEYSKLEDELKSLRLEYATSEQESTNFKRKYEEELEQLRKMQAAENWAKQEIDRSNKQIEELKQAFQIECSKLEKIREQSEQEWTEKIRQKDQMLNKNDAAIRQLEEENSKLAAQLTNCKQMPDNSEVMKQLETSLSIKDQEGVIIDVNGKLNGVQENGGDDRRKQEDAETYYVDFEWDPVIEGRMPQKSVQVTGSFDNWTERTSLSRSNFDTFKGRLKLPKGNYEFKFIIDEHAWLCSKKYPMIGLHGSENNTVTIDH
uniref:5'-AMP-activated protein kinase subunit beta-1 n=1 Tax=Romanomermis culicivorax TaxID=13658 RepID=A0A915INI2_ROMCU